jgi:hypothetical protein
MIPPLGALTKGPDDRVERVNEPSGEVRPEVDLVPGEKNYEIVADAELRQTRDTRGCEPPNASNTKPWRKPIARPSPRPDVCKPSSISGR